MTRHHARSGVRARAGWWLWVHAWKLVGLLAVAAIMVAVWPVTVTAVAGYLAAWLSGQPPARLWRAAAWSVPMTGVWLLAHAMASGTWQGVALAPVRDWRASWHQAAAAHIPAAFAVTAPAAIPLGLAAAAIGWGWRNYAIASGLAGFTASAPIIFDARQWRRQARTAQARIAAPGAVPLLDSRGRIPVGGTIRTIGHRWQPVLRIPAALLGRHSVIVGATGTGKTSLMMRLWAGWYAATRRASTAAGRPRPLLVVLDCKGGPDARVKAERTRRLLYGAGASRVAIWPDEARLCIWDLPPATLSVLLFSMVESGERGAAFYADVLQAVTGLAVTAPPGPPRSSAGFLARLDPGWLARAWGDGQHPAQAARVQAARPHLGDIHLRFSVLLARLGPALDGPGTLTDADAWYCILEGTREQPVAEAQALALTELTAHAAAAVPPRQILLAADDYSAVSRRVPLANLYERGRSLGIGVQVSAQSWHGLGRDDDERSRIAATADAGIWVFATPIPEPLCELAGTRRVLETAHHLIGSAWGDEGTTREQRAFTADPDLIRRLATGQACYIRRGTATFVAVARPRPSPLTLPPPPATAASRQRAAAGLPAPRPEPAAGQQASLDDVLGPGAAP